MYPYRRRRNINPAALAVGDLVVIVVLVALGAIHHGHTDPLHILTVAVPFLIGWLVIFPIAGAYRDYPSRRNQLFALLGTWQAAALVGLGIRSTSFFAGNSPPSFGFVMIVLGGFTVAVWRFVVVRLVVVVVRLTR